MGAVGVPDQFITPRGAGYREEAVGALAGPRRFRGHGEPGGADPDVCANGGGPG